MKVRSENFSDNKNNAENEDHSKRINKKSMKDFIVGLCIQERCRESQ